MKNILLALSLILSFTLILFPSLGYAQNFPVTVTVAWDMNADTDAVTSYSVTLDGANTQTIPASSCALATRTCNAPLVIANNSNHVVSLTATNQWGTSAPTSVTFRVSVPASPSNIKISK